MELENAYEKDASLSYFRKGHHVCYICGKRFQKSQYLKQHYIVHSARQHVCPLCSKAYKSRAVLNVHLQAHAPDNFQCYHCDKTFRWRWSWKMHIKKCMTNL